MDQYLHYPTGNEESAAKFPAIDRALDILRHRLGVNVRDIIPEEVDLSFKKCALSGFHNNYNIFSPESWIDIRKKSIQYHPKCPQQRIVVSSKRKIAALIRLFSLLAIKIQRQYFGFWIHKVIQMPSILRSIHIRSNNIWTKDYFLKKFTPAFRKSCIARLGKIQLAKLYNKWRLTRQVFSMWIDFVRL